MDPVLPTSDETNLLTAMLAGSVSAVAQSVLTYPFEYYKTTSQIENKALIKAPHQIPMNSIRPLFTGCMALATGNVLKASTRFLIFNKFSNFMANDSGQTSAPRVVVAGLLTGAVETVWVIPFENIKTRMIENSMYKQGFQTNLPSYVTAETNRSKITKRPTGPLNYRKEYIDFYNKNPSTTFFKIIKEIYLTKGLSGFKQGSLITIFRQSMNSMVWFSTYNFLQQFIDPSRESITEIELMGMGIASSCAVVATTQPIDLLKTRMQTKNYRLIYRDIMTCTIKIFMEEGALKLWSGWLPRLLKVSCSSSVTLITYDYVQKGLNYMVDIKPFAAE
ncbi:hypothetical protein CANARDRAFT_9272 [[Candida] arabinofermentans NRRL YB-2248]|uniref:Mitochondrial carrier protein n=1 Tax=[Candida] arabinofermentans NRRL YB-2248 TaxID=983967 RepID=A0A1E4SW23_9ASCO|nr:hypothetical protein CANARDRAFT_9272 [[Candida] arabinofermentans NRRL YB-2248]